MKLGSGLQLQCGATVATSVKAQMPLLLLQVLSTVQMTSIEALPSRIQGMVDFGHRCCCVFVSNAPWQTSASHRSPCTYTHMHLSAVQC